MYNKRRVSTTHLVPLQLMLPSGLSNTGFLNFAVVQDSDSTLNSGFNVVRFFPLRILCCDY